MYHQGYVEGPRLGTYQYYMEPFPSCIGAMYYLFIFRTIVRNLKSYASIVLIMYVVT